MYKLIRPILFQFDPESIHNKIFGLGHSIQNSKLLSSLTSRTFQYKNERLQTNVFALNFENPVGLAAGFDKNALLMDFFYSLGFGFIEIGSITAKPSKGNERPRLFRLQKDRAIINRMGLNEEGVDIIHSRLLFNIQNRKYPVGVNIAKTNDINIVGDEAVKDFLYSFDKLFAFVDYITLNISCPNTEDGRTFENNPNDLNSLLKEIRSRNSNKPILIKLSPDISREDLENTLDVCNSNNMGGYIVTNTSIERNLTTSRKVIERIGKGGLSGKPIQQKSTQMVRLVYKLTQGEIPIIGVGGIDSAESAYEKIKAGASLVQLYTGLVYEGPVLIKKINNGLVELLEGDGLSNISEAVGVEN